MGGVDQSGEVELTPPFRDGRLNVNDWFLGFTRRSRFRKLSPSGYWFGSFANLPTRLFRDRLRSDFWSFRAQSDRRCEIRQRSLCIQKRFHVHDFDGSLDYQLYQVELFRDLARRSSGPLLGIIRVDVLFRLSNLFDKGRNGHVTDTFQLFGRNSRDFLFGPDTHDGHGARRFPLRFATMRDGRYPALPCSLQYEERISCRIFQRIVNLVLPETFDANLYSASRSIFDRRDVRIIDCESGTELHNSVL